MRSSTLTLRENSKPSSTFNKLLALVRDEHVKSLEALHDEYRGMYQSTDLITNSCRLSDTTLTALSMSVSDGEDEDHDDVPSEGLVQIPQLDANLSQVDSEDRELHHHHLGTHTCANVSDSEQSRLPSKKQSTRTFKACFADHFEPRKAWLEMAFVSRGSMMSRLARTRTISDIFDNEEDHVYDCGLTTHFMMHPNSKKLLAWDLMGFLLIAYEMIVLPLQAFDLDESGFLYVAEWLGRIFWTFDMPMSTLRGFFREGCLFMSFHQTLKRYLSTWFVLDGSLVLIDWVLLIVDSETSQDHSIGVVRVLRVTRLARMLRVLRILKLQRLFASISDVIHTDIVMIYFRFTKPIVGILFLVHWIACGWYWIGTIGEGEDWEKDWLTTSGSRQRSKAYRYCTSLHWSLSQFTLGAIDVHAQNAYERLYTISVLLFGVVAFSTIIGGFTSAVEEIREIRSDKNNQFQLLRRFLRDYKVSQALTTRIQKYCEFSYEHQKSRTQESDVKVLELVSEQLKQELSKEIYTPELKAHPLFGAMLFHQCKCLDKICRTALLPRSYAQGDVIFARDVATIGMILLTDGQCNYIQRTADGNKTSIKVWKDEWMCEPVLWTNHWLTVGKARAALHSRAIFVDAYWFEKVFAEVDPSAWELVHLYALKFIDMLNSLDSSDVNDLLPGVRDGGTCETLSHAVMSNVEWPNGAKMVPTDSDKTVSRASRMMRNAARRVSKRMSPRAIDAKSFDV